jgi:general stress protein YciG
VESQLLRRNVQSFTEIGKKPEEAVFEDMEQITEIGRKGSEPRAEK